MKTKKIVNPSMVRLLFFLCWFIYLASYIGRRNFSALMPQMMADGVLSASQAGSINTIFFLTYACGQLINGLLGDRLHPSHMALFGALTSAFCNIAMGLCGGYLPMFFIWALNGYALSMLWAPFLRLFAEMLTEKDRIRCTVNLSSSCSLGNMASYLLCSLIVFLSGWRLSFILSALPLLAGAILWPVLFRRLSRHQAQSAVEEASDAPSSGASPKSAPQTSTSSFLSLLLSLSFILLLSGAMMQGMLRDGVTSWVPSFITEGFQTDPSLASLITTALPIVNLLGPYLGHLVNQKLFHSESLTSAFFFLVAALALLALLCFGRHSLGLTLLLFALLTTCIEAVNLMLISLLPLRYSYLGHTATITGLLNFLTYVGAAVSTFGIGLLVKHHGWNFALSIWLLIAAIGLLLCLLSRYQQYRSQQRQR